MAEMTPYQEDIKQLYAQGLNLDALQGRSLLVAGATGLVGACVVDIVMADPHRNLRVFAGGQNGQESINNSIYGLREGGCKQMHFVLVNAVMRTVTTKDII